MRRKKVQAQEKKKGTRVKKQGGEPAGPVDFSGELLNPIHPSHAPELKAAFKEAGCRAWCCFVPFFYFTSETGRNEIYWKIDDDGRPVILYRKSRGGSDRWDLYTLAAASKKSAQRHIELLDTLNDGAYGRILWLPEDQLEYIANIHSLEPEYRDNEYFYDTGKVSLLSGPGFAHVRKRVNRFLRENPEMELISLDRPGVRRECIELMDAWRRDYDERGRPAPLLDHYYTKRALEAFREFSEPDLFGFAALIEGKVAGFAIAGEMKSGLANFFALKADTRVTGLSEYMRWVCIDEMHERGYELVNDASDLNVPGLERHKSKFRPVEKLNIYRVARK